MNINRGSWHYKLIVDYCKLNEPKTLCGYFCMLAYCILSVLCSLFCTVALALGALLFFVTSALVLASPYIDLFTGGYHDVSDNVLSLIAWIALVVFVAIKTKSFSWIFSRDNKTKEKTSSINVIFNFIKAKKQKICPIVEYKD